MGRRSDYTDEIAEEICEQLADGKSLRTICADKKMPTRATIRNWRLRNPEFLSQYARAREEQADAIFDDIVDIADKAGTGGELTVDMARVRIDARKWVAGKLAPKKYGDKTTIDTTATVKVEHTRKLDISTLSDEQLDALEGALRATVAQLGGPVIEHEE